MSNTLTIFHYHLLTGGITQVVTASLSALLGSKKDPEITRVRLVCGVEEHTEEVLGKIRGAAEAAGREAIELEIAIVPELRYISEMEEIPTPETIVELMLDRFAGDIWWVHNYHLGKNPLFTEALLRIAERHPEQRMVFHIHDFPESGRFDNLELLYSQLSSPWYPIGAQIRYAVINGRDYSILHKAGVPEPQLFLLDNPVAPKPQPAPSPDSEEDLSAEEAEDKQSTASIIRDYCSSTSAFWEEGGKLALYPVRTIRRKNVLEAGLIVRLLPRPVNLLVTLPGVSAQQRDYSDFVGQCFAEELIPGAFPVGTFLDDIGIGFSDLTGSADMIISSSIQEGFGYLFLNALEWNVPLLSRDLDILDGMRGIFEGYPACFYSRLLVPIGEDSRIELFSEYQRKVLPQLEKTLFSSEVNAIEEEIREMCDADPIDFSFLSLKLQKEVLQRLANPTYRKEVEEANKELIESLAYTMEERTVDKSAEIADRFGPEAHAAEVRRILASFGEHSQGPAPAAANGEERNEPRGGSIHRKVLSRFLELEYMRLLYF